MEGNQSHCNYNPVLSSEREGNQHESDEESESGNSEKSIPERLRDNFQSYERENTEDPNARFPPPSQGSNPLLSRNLNNSLEESKAENRGNETNNLFSRVVEGRRVDNFLYNSVAPNSNPHSVNADNLRNSQNSRNHIPIDENSIEEEIKNQIEANSLHLSQNITLVVQQTLETQAISDYSIYTVKFLSEFETFSIEKTLSEKLCCSRGTNLSRLKRLKACKAGESKRKLVDIISLKFGALNSSMIGNHSIIDLYLASLLIEIRNVYEGIENNSSILDKIREISNESIKKLETNNIRDSDIPKIFFEDSFRSLIDYYGRAGEFNRI